MAAPAVVVLCHEYAALAGVAVAGVAEFLADAAALAVRLLPTAQSARIRVRVPEVVTAIADAPDAELFVDAPGTDHPADPRRARCWRSRWSAAATWPVLELDPGARDGFPADERELAEVLAVLLTLSLGDAAA